MSDSNAKILCVDDRQEIIDLLAYQLNNDYECRFALGAEQALHLIDAEGPFAAIVTDYAMPTMDGITLLNLVSQRAPDTPRIMLTAFDDVETAIAAVHDGKIFRFLRKPWQARDLKRALADAVAQYNLVTAEHRLTRDLAQANNELDKKVNELHELNRLLEYWVEFSPAVLYSATVDDNKVQLSYVSKNFVRLTGHERTALIVDPNFWYKNVHADDAESVRNMLVQALHDITDSHSIRYRARHIDGEYRTIVDSFRTIRSAGGEPLEFVGAWMSITP